MPQDITPSQLIINLITLLIIGGLTAYYAQTKGRSPIVWFILGFLFSIFAPLILFFLPSVPAENGNGKPTMTVSRPSPRESLNVPPPPKLLPLPEEDKLWYYLNADHQQIGPVSIIALRELWNTGQLELTSYVWSEGMATWEQVDRLPHLKEALKRPMPA